MLVPFEHEPKAHYVCAMLNSSPAQFIAFSYSINIQIDTHVLKNVRVLSFDSSNSGHTRLAVLSQPAHGAATSGDAERANGIEAEIDQLAAQVWGLTAVELHEIQQGLAELS